MRTDVTRAGPTGPTVAGAVVDRVTDELQARVRPWLATREGVACVSVSAATFLLLWGPLDVPLLAGALGAAFAAIPVSLAARLWEARTTPRTPAFAELSPRVDGRLEVRCDPNAGFWRDKRGFLNGDRVWFAGTGCPPCRLRPDLYLRLRAWRDQGDLPVFVARACDRQWWWWRDTFYWESGDYEPKDVRVLLLMLERDDEQGLEWELDLHLAEPIPVEVKRLVFERDRGRCRACGSGELLQFDHVVPSSMGGGNGPQNIRLLCAECNRR